MKIKCLIVILLVVFTSCKKEKKNNIEDATSNKSLIFKVNEGNNCFKEIIENKVKNGEDTVIEINELIIKLNIDGNNVSGNFDYIPYKEKVNKGVFTGTLETNIAKTICVFDQNGKVKKEEVIFKIEENKISILGGEKEEIDGVWKFKDASKGFYMNEIPRVNCN